MDQDRENLNKIADQSAQEAVEKAAEKTVEESAEEMPVQEDQAAPAQQEFYYTPAEEVLPQEPQPAQESEKKGRDHVALILGCVAVGCYLLDYWFGCCCLGGVLAPAAVVLAIISLVLALRYKKQAGSLSDKGVAAVIISAIVLVLSVFSAIAGFFGGLASAFSGIFDALMEEGSEDFSLRFDFAIRMLTHL